MLAVITTVTLDPAVTENSPRKYGKKYLVHSMGLFREWA